MGNMKHGIPTTTKPHLPDKLYMRCMFHEFFFGPFDDEQAVAAACRQLDKADSFWDYDSFCVHYGANPLPDDFVRGFKFVDPEVRARIEVERAVP